MYLNYLKQQCYRVYIVCLINVYNLDDLHRAFTAVYKLLLSSSLVICSNDVTKLHYHIGSCSHECTPLRQDASKHSLLHSNTCKNY